MARQKLSHIFTKIVFKPLRTNLFHIVLSAIFLTLGTAETYSQEGKNKSTSIAAEKQPNTKKDSVSVSLSDITKSADTTAQDTIKPKKTFLESRVKRKAVDYEKMDQKKKQLTLYNKAELYYQDFELKAGIIVMDYEKNEVYAGRIKDSAGNYTQRPIFKQGTNVIEPDSIRFNTITKKALVWNSRSAQGDLNIKGEVTKKENDSVYFIKNARITTSKNIDDPEYYFLARKLKLVPGKKVVVGLTNMVIADVPT
ncbi:MAG: organic solvent tolerance protein OstA, partial [Flavobacterium johnsoniae]